MTVARDSFGERATFTTVTPALSNFTPVGTPRAIVVFLAHGIESTDLITSVSYGGVAMTRVPTNGFAQDTAGEPGASYAYFLGASIPTGLQQVSIVHTGSTTTKWAITVSYTAAGDTQIGASGKLEGDQANPQLALNTAVSSIRACILYSGHDAGASVAVLAGMEAVGALNSVDFGTDGAFMGQQSTASTGSFTIGFTATSEDTAFIALAIQEIPVAQNLTGTLFQRAPTFPLGVLTLGAAPPAPAPVGGSNRMGGNKAIRKPPRHVGR